MNLCSPNRTAVPRIACECTAEMIDAMEITTAEVKEFDCAIEYAFVDTPYAPALEAWCRYGLCYLGFCTGSREQAIADMRRRFPRSTFAQCAARERYNGAAAERICLVGTEFQRRVWLALLDVPRGSTISYGELARRVGHSAGLGVRAVARAVGANPIGLILPCHRVVGADGSLHGYFWGIDIKRRILETEATATGGGGVAPKG